MSKLRVGVMVYAESLPTEGGGHSYYDILLKGINDFEFHPAIEIINIVFYNNHIPALNLKKQSIYIKIGFGIKFKDAVKKTTSRSNLILTRQNSIINFFSNSVINARNKKAEKILKENNIDLIYYLKPEFHILNCCVN